MVRVHRTVTLDSRTMTEVENYAKKKFPTGKNPGDFDFNKAIEDLVLKGFQFEGIELDPMLILGGRGVKK